MVFITVKNYIGKINKIFRKGAAFYSQGLVLRALFQKAEVTVSRVYVVLGFHCIMVEGTSRYAGGRL